MSAQTLTAGPFPNVPLLVQVERHLAAVRHRRTRDLESFVMIDPSSSRALEIEAIPKAVSSRRSAVLP
jgi:hypothetical protein